MQFKIDKYGIRLRLAEISDAEFILKLRNDPKLGRYLSPTNIDINRQIEWLEKYKIKEKKNEEYYFIAEDQFQNRYGTIRLYNFINDSFESGSWVFSNDTPPDMAIKADIIGREFAFEFLQAKYCRFEVLKDNKSVVRYQLRYHPTIISEDESKFYFMLSKEKFDIYKTKLLKLFNLKTT